MLLIIDIFPVCNTYSVPNLQLDNFVIYLEAIWAEFYSNSDLMFLFEPIVHNSLHQATLSDASVPNYDELEEMVLCWNCFIWQYLKRDLFDLFNLTLLHDAKIMFDLILITI